MEGEVNKPSPHEVGDEIAYIKHMIDTGTLLRSIEMIKYWKAVRSFGVFAGDIHMAKGGSSFMGAGCVAYADVSGLPPKPRSLP